MSGDGSQVWQQTMVTLETRCVLCDATVKHTDTAEDMGADTTLGQLVKDHENWHVDNDGWLLTEDGLTCAKHWGVGR